jgi:hypothetical protein
MFCYICLLLLMPYFFCISPLLYMPLLLVLLVYL